MEDDVKEEIQEEEVKEDVQEETAEMNKPLDKMTAIELREVAADIPSITGAHAMKNEELPALIKEAKGITEETPARKRKVTRLKREVSVKTLKKKIIQFKAEKGAARMEKDKIKINILRRRINRLKKRARRVAQG